MSSLPSQRKLLPIAATITKISFTLFLILSLTTPSWRGGPFRWWPLWHFPLLAGAPVAIGPFNLLPLFIALGWFVTRWWRGAKRPVWQWGITGLTLPLLGFTILGLLSLEPDLTRRTFTQGGGLALFWLVYLFVLNERPFLPLPLLIITFTQGTVAIVQFALQRDLGLVDWGELPLNPAFEGITVLYARNQPWLRAYGLTAHPNLLGAILAMLLLWLLPLIGRWHGWRQFLLILAVSVGLMGLFASFSRSAWLAFGVGLLVWLIWYRRPSIQAQPREKRPFSLIRTIPLIPLLFLLIFNYDLALSRLVDLKTPIEATSLNERLSDGRLALQLIQQHPWRGVGLGNYELAAQRLDATARRVHNVPLYVTAELGLPAALLWLWLMVAPFIQYPKKPDKALLSRSMPLIAWSAMLVMNMFDTMVWWSSNWQTAVLFALLAAQTSQSLTSASHRGCDSPESQLV
jgi:hypothetical protein